MSTSEITRENSLVFTLQNTLTVLSGLKQGSFSTCSWQVSMATDYHIAAAQSCWNDRLYGHVGLHVHAAVMVGEEGPDCPYYRAFCSGYGLTPWEEEMASEVVTHVNTYRHVPVED
jgi:hypothetical protein